jgi:hypothetical protein
MDAKRTVLWSVVGVLCLSGVIGGCMWGMPQYKVWHQHMDGEAELAKAEFTKQVQVADAKGKMESAKLLAQAEIERAKGVAEANRIIGEGLKGNEVYLHYLWLHSLDNVQAHGGTVIYVPTESNMPLMEAGRFANRPSAPPVVALPKK